MTKKKTLVALLVCMAATAFAGSGGSYTWEGTGASYDAVRGSLVLENAKLTKLVVNTDKTGAKFTIEVKGICSIIPTSKIDGISVNTNSGSGSGPELVIVGRTPDAQLTVAGQSHAGIYFQGTTKTCTLYMAALDLVCQGKLQDAQYGIAAEGTNKLKIEYGPNLQVSMEGRSAPFNNIVTMWAGTYKAKLIYPVGGSMNEANSNNFVKDANGEQYYGLTTLVTKYAVEVGEESIYRGEEEFTSPTSGKVSIKDGILIFDNAVTGNLDINYRSIYGIKIKGTNVVNGDADFYMDEGNGIILDFPFDGDGANASLTINGVVRFADNLALSVDNVALRNYSDKKSFCIYSDSYKSTMMLQNGASVYVEAPENGIAYPSASAGLCVDWENGYRRTDGTTEEGNKFTYIRYVNDYGVSVNSSMESGAKTVLVTNETAADVLGDGSVVFDANSNTLTLNNANLSSIDYLTGPSYINHLNIRLIGNNMIFSTSSTASLLYLLNETRITGNGSLVLIGQESGQNGIVVRNDLYIENTSVNISVSSGYAIRGFSNDIQGNVHINNSNVTMQSGIEGVITNINSFELSRAAYAAPADVAFFNGQLCVNFQPVAANTKVEIKALAEGLDDVLANPADKAQKVLIDGQVYIIRDGKAYNMLGSEVK